MKRLLGALVVLLQAACGGSDTSPAAPATPSPATGSCPAGAVVSGTPDLTLTTIASGLQSPLDLQSAPGDRARLFVVEQAGRIRILRGGTLVAAPFLDIVARVGSGGERGLLGLAFHPQFAANGRFYVNYTDRNGDTHISEFRAASATADTVDPGSERELMFVAQPFANHNGGGLGFASDGTLYIGLGDGGSGGDPQRNGQNRGVRLGKLLRISVDSGSPYGIPADNPFATAAGVLPEIYAFGLRNPWRFSFDRATGDLYIGDVGQNAIEEIDVELAPRRGGQNYGWNVTEGSRCFNASSCNMAGITLPVLEYPRPDGASVTGGVVYRGCRMPGYAGTYFYGDFVSGFVRSFRLSGGAAVERRDWTTVFRSVRNPSAFGVDQDGEVYIVEYGGTIFRISPAS